MRSTWNGSCATSHRLQQRLDPGGAIQCCKILRPASKICVQVFTTTTTMQLHRRMSSYLTLRSSPFSLSLKSAEDETGIYNNEKQRKRCAPGGKLRFHVKVCICSRFRFRAPMAFTQVNVDKILVLKRRWVECGVGEELRT
jgi:hypothetical protein